MGATTFAFVLTVGDAETTEIPRAADMEAIGDETRAAAAAWTELTMAAGVDVEPGTAAWGMVRIVSTSIEPAFNRIVRKQVGSLQLRLVLSDSFSSAS